MLPQGVSGPGSFIACLRLLTFLNQFGLVFSLMKPVMKLFLDVKVESQWLQGMPIFSVWSYICDCHNLPFHILCTDQLTDVPWLICYGFSPSSTSLFLQVLSYPLKRYKEWLMFYFLQGCGFHIF